ncbi:MAG TPA: IS1 family transposase [Pyrinomonadaceae bacterium]
MQTKEITCPRCSRGNIIKHGTTRAGKQRYRCKHCRRQFIINYTYCGHNSTVRQLIVPLSLNGCGIRDISRVLHLSTNTVLKLLRRHAATVHRPRLPEHITELEIDEMWSFVRCKEQPAWLWYAFEPQSKQIVAWLIGEHTDHSCRRLFKQLKRCRVLRFCTDEWQSYQKLIPWAQHWVGKQWTQDIERQNLNFRTHLKRLQRRTICFSKSTEMHEALIKLYIDQHNRQHHL